MIGRGHHDREHRRPSGRELESSTVGLDECPSEREPDTVARSAGEPSTEDVGRHVVGDAGALVGHGDTQHVALEVADGDPTLSAPVLQRVVDEHADRFTQPTRTGAAGNRVAGEGCGHRAPLCGEGLIEVTDEGHDQRRHVDAVGLNRLVA